MTTLPTFLFAGHWPASAIRAVTLPRAEGAARRRDIGRSTLDVPGPPGRLRDSRAITISLFSSYFDAAGPTRRFDAPAGGRLSIEHHIDIAAGAADISTRLGSAGRSFEFTSRRVTEAGHALRCR
jgi:hypothetical protein